MRKLYTYLMSSLDGFHEGPGGAGDLGWHHTDQEFVEFAVSQLNDASMLLFGRTTYQLMASFWPSEQARSEDPLTATRMNELPKIVFSTTLTTADWHNTELVSGGVAERIAELKQGSGGELAVLGSARLTASLLEQGLLDELRVMVNPVALGSGTPLLGGLTRAVQLELRQTRTFASGNVLLNYRPLPING
jgi:dihydrofolate reductase